MAKEREARASEPQTTYVDDSKSFVFDLELGAGRRWRDYGGGKFVKVPNDDADLDAQSFRHVPALHRKVGPFTGKIVNGLVETYRMWARSNAAQEPDGDLRFLVRVSNVKESDAEPLDDDRMIPISQSRLERLIRNIVVALKTQDNTLRS